MYSVYKHLFVRLQEYSRETYLEPDLLNATLVNGKIWALSTLNR